MKNTSTNAVAEKALSAARKAGTRKTAIHEALTQLKSDKARGVAKRLSPESGISADDVMALAELDPSSTGSNIEWLVRLMKANRNFDRAAAVAAITNFDNLRRIPAFAGDRNIMSYRTLVDLETVVNQNGQTKSQREKEKALQPLIKEIQKRWPLKDKGGDDLKGGGYAGWATKLCKAGDFIPGEDDYKVLDALTEFEKKRLDPDFTSSKNIDTYPNLRSLLAAIEAENQVDGIHEKLPPMPGLEFISATRVNGHYYDMYKVTKFEAGQKLWHKSNFPPSSAGWCVVTKGNWDSYGFGPSNPGLFWRKDGLNFVLGDMGKGHGGGNLMDRNDKRVEFGTIFELLYLQMPSEIKDFILSRDPATQKYKKEILSSGPEAAFVQAYKDGTTEGIDARFGTISEKAKDAIHFLKVMDWKEAKPATLELVKTNPVMWMIYVTNVLRRRDIPTEPVILQNAEAAAAYFNVINERKWTPGFPGSKWPELEQLLIEKDGLPISALGLYCAKQTSPLPPALEKLLAEKKPDVFKEYEARVKSKAK